jgi:RNA polymerase sigma-70 factor (ECF subfamily)
LPRTAEPAWDWKAVHSRCLRETRRFLRGADAEDAAQEAALRAWVKRGQCRSEHARAAWITKIARNEALRLLSANRPELGDGSDESVRPAVPDPTPDAIAALDFERALALLDAQDSRVAHLRFVEDLSDRGVAERMGTPIGTAKVRLHRLRAKLGQALNEYAPQNREKAERR